MKKVISVLIILITISVAAQDSCSPFYPSKEGKTYIIHHYDKKDRLSTVSENTISDKSSGSIEIVSKVKDKRGKEIVSGNFKVVCSGGTTTLTPEAIIAPGLLEQYRNMEYSITGDGLSFPANLSVGQELADGQIVMKVDAGIMNMTTTVTMTDRKVIGKEKMTTPAGTFDCYVITYTNKLEMGMVQTNTSKQWIAKGIGMVKEETRKQNGRLVTTSILNQIK
ncbi:hypothetical protein [Aquimarina celericrescens]|uniref:DUF3108 domain-containing protein n=1 Tax=Aquimarina celericrescens TaxID=1964542 RepID=A0ABW5AUL9_9FLAO|nr:hypothetical protein [Aquimarina celericrescens]